MFCRSVIVTGLQLREDLTRHTALIIWQLCSWLWNKGKQQWFDKTPCLMRLCCNSCVYSISKQAFHSGLGTPILIFPNTKLPHPILPQNSPTHPLPLAFSVPHWVLASAWTFRTYSNFSPILCRFSSPLPLRSLHTHPFDCDWQRLCSIVRCCRLWWRHIHRAEELRSLYIAQKLQVCNQLHRPLMISLTIPGLVNVASQDTARYGRMGQHRVCTQDKLSLGYQG